MPGLILAVENTGDGPAAATDTSAIGDKRTITLNGDFLAVVTVQGSSDGTTFVDICAFPAAGSLEIVGSFAFMRTRTSGFASMPTPVVCTVAGDSGTVVAAQLALPVGGGDGTGAIAAVGAMGGGVRTIICTGANPGCAVFVEASTTNNNATWQQVACFYGPGFVNVEFECIRMRTSIAGMPSGLSFTGAVSVCATTTGATPVSAAGAFVPQGGPFFVGAPTVRSGQAIFVNPADPAAVDDGDAATPKITITGAIACIDAPTSELEQQQVWTIFVAGGCYDEDVVLPSFGVWMQIVALGKVTIGDGTLTGGGSTTPRSVTWLPDDAASHTFRTVVFSSLDAGGIVGASSTDGSLGVGTAYGWRVSGDVVVDNAASPSTDNVVLDLTNALVEGDVDTSGFTPFPLRLSMVNVEILGNLDPSTSTVVSLIRGSIIRGTIGPTANLRRIERTEVLGAITIGAAQSAGEWFDSRPLPAFNLDPTSAPPTLDKFTASYLADFLWAPPLGPFPNEALELIGVWGAADIGAAAGTVYLPPGNGATTVTNAWGIGTTRNCFLAQIACTINLAVADGDNITVNVLADGSQVATTGPFPSTGGVHNFNLNPMVLITRTTRISVEVVKNANITNGAVNFTVALYSY
jgi:hypothetical protein